jgi:zinc transporter 1
MLGVMLHVAGDALNNLGVAIAAVIIWKTDNPARYYADPGVSLLIAVMIVVTAVPLVKRSGEILLQTVPVGVDPIDVRHDLEKVCLPRVPSNPGRMPRIRRMRLC